MNAEEIIQIENEVYTKIIIDELQKQKVAGKPIKDYLIDKREIDELTQKRLKEILRQR